MRKKISKLLAAGSTALALMFGLVASVPSAATADVPPPAHPALINAQASLLWDNYTDAQRVRLLDQMRSAGMDSFRMDVSWAAVQPASWAWDRARLAQLDKIVLLANRRGMKPLITFWLAPRWANGSNDNRVPPKSAPAYATALAQMVARYRGRVLGWQVWNEPNLTQYWHDGSKGKFTDPTRYVRLLCAANWAAKHADPRTWLLTGGTSNVDTAWIQKMYARGARGCFDVMAVHPYMGPLDGSPKLVDDGTPWRMDHVRSLRAMMVRLHDAKPIWFTEFGWSTAVTRKDAPGHQRGVSEKVQAAYITQTGQLLRSRWPYVRRAYVYTIQDTHRQRPTQSDLFNSFGLIRSDGTAKPALVAVRTVNG